MSYGFISPQIHLLTIRIMPKEINCLSRRAPRILRDERVPRSNDLVRGTPFHETTLSFTTYESEEKKLPDLTPPMSTRTKGLKRNDSRSVAESALLQAIRIYIVCRDLRLKPVLDISYGNLSWSRHDTLSENIHADGDNVLPIARDTEAVVNMKYIPPYLQRQYLTC